MRAAAGGGGSDRALRGRDRGAERPTRRTTPTPRTPQPPPRWSPSPLPRRPPRPSPPTTSEPPPHRRRPHPPPSTTSPPPTTTVAADVAETSALVVALGGADFRVGPRRRHRPGRRLGLRRHRVGAGSRPWPATSTSSTGRPTQPARSSGDSWRPCRRPRWSPRRSAQGAPGSSPAIDWSGTGSDEPPTVAAGGSRRSRRPAGCSSGPPTGSLPHRAGAPTRSPTGSTSAAPPRRPSPCSACSRSVRGPTSPSWSFWPCWAACVRSLRWAAWRAG